MLRPIGWKKHPLDNYYHIVTEENLVDEIPEGAI